MTSPAVKSPPTYRDGRLHAPATERNRGPILEVLQRILPSKGLVLEIAAGSGEHSVFFSAALPHLTWQPTDAKASNLASIDAWAAAKRAEGQALPSLRQARSLDTTMQPWLFMSAQAILCINMIHISPWAATQGLMKGAADVLPKGGVLYTYGPYKVEGQHTSESNAKFELWLKNKDGAFGIRDVADVKAEAAKHGLKLSEVIPMPANNFSLVFHRQ